LPLHIAGCERAARAGAAVLEGGGSALDAVQCAVEVLEADPLFNAGTGACLDEDGHLALDASIMEGTGLRAGAVCVLPAFEHPVAIARAVLERSPHVLLAAEGAVRFALANGFVAADEAAMITALARERLDAARERRVTEGWAGGTVGAVARDVHGHVAAATSTGGLVNKAKGRVGDSPILGAGTYADDAAGACSTTGDGEAMMRLAVAKTCIEWLRFQVAPEAAARSVLTLLRDRTAGEGGLLLVDRDGRVGLARSTRTMSWAAVIDGVLASGG
jgi:beta-aspartyl-peptidase (threonine type)